MATVVYVKTTVVMEASFYPMEHGTWLQRYTVLCIDIVPCGFFFDDPKPHDAMKVDILVLLLKLGICLDVIVAFREIATKL